MLQFAKVRSALDRGGVPELVRLTRKWLAAKIYPGPLPRATRRRPAATGPKAAEAARATVTVEKSFAGSVDHVKALDWFETRRQNYERLAAAVAPHIDRTGVILDVGANIGYFTKVLGEELDFRGSVHLFEPIPNLAGLCRRTLLEVPYSTTVHEFGLSDEDGTIDIFVANDGNLGWNTIVADKATTGMKALQIQVRAFDTSGIDVTPSFIKIDVEGAEYKVLRGMLGAIEQWSPRPVILCEIGWGSAHPEWEQELEVFGELEKLGYRAVDLDQQPINLEELTKTTDVIFVSEDAG